jgi:hypothetical protein
MDDRQGTSPCQCLFSAWGSGARRGNDLPEVGVKSFKGACVLCVCLRCVRLRVVRVRGGLRKDFLAIGWRRRGGNQKAKAVPPFSTRAAPAAAAALSPHHCPQGM